MEKETLAERIKGMSDEEKMFIIRFIPSNYLSFELERRCTGSAKMLTSIDDIINSLNRESTLKDMQIALIKIKEVLY
jgi:hypothetical protein